MDDIEQLKCEIAQLKKAIAEADQKIRMEINYAGQFPGGAKELEWSLDGLLKKYRQLLGRQ